MVLYRIYCTNCKRYELHFKQFTKDLTDSSPDAQIQFQCFECGHITAENADDVKIPYKLVYEQRKRWYIARNLGKLTYICKLSKYLQRLLTSDLMSDNAIGRGLREADIEEIVESDAGAIDLHNQWAQAHNDIIEKYKAKVVGWHMQERNEPCQCGSGLKFKKCCLNRIEQLNEQCAAELKDLEQEHSMQIYGDPLFMSNWRDHVKELQDSDGYEQASDDHESANN